MARNFEVSWDDESGKASATWKDYDGEQGAELTYKLTTNTDEDGVERRSVNVTSVNGCTDLRVWGTYNHRFENSELDKSGVTPQVLENITLIIETKDHGVIC